MTLAAPEGAPPEAAPKPVKDPVRRWTWIVAALLLLLLVLQIASDRTAPLTTIATVEVLVLPISPRVSGELMHVAVADNQTVEAGGAAGRDRPDAVSADGGGRGPP